MPADVRCMCGCDCALSFCKMSVGIPWTYGSATGCSTSLTYRRAVSVLFIHTKGDHLLMLMAAQAMTPRWQAVLRPKMVEGLAQLPRRLWARDRVKTTLCDPSCQVALARRHQCMCWRRWLGSRRKGRFADKPASASLRETVCIDIGAFKTPRRFRRMSPTIVGPLLGCVDLCVVAFVYVLLSYSFFCPKKEKIHISFFGPPSTNSTHDCCITLSFCLNAMHRPTVYVGLWYYL